MREILRAETQELHRGLDSAVGETDPFSSHRSYRNYLRCMYQLYAAYLIPLDNASKLFDMPIHSQATIQCLEQDINWLDSNSPTALANSLPSENPSNSDGPLRENTDSQSRSVGIAYTLEGSAMGASFMIKSVRNNQDFRGALAFLSKLSLDARERWPVFRTHLENYQGDVADAVGGARDVFATATKIFSESRTSSSDG